MATTESFAPAVEFQPLAGWHDKRTPSRRTVWRGGGREMSKGTSNAQRSMGRRAGAVVS